jgi:hypothetical protein
MIDLCKIFGVEEGEEFKLEYENIKDNELIYKVNNGLRCKAYGGDFIRSELKLNNLLNVKEIIKLPKKKEFTYDELAIMRSLPKEYKWMARDTGIGNVSAFKEKPTKNEYGYWINEGKYCILIIFNHLFKSITSEDEETVFIDDYVDRGGE